MIRVVSNLSPYRRIWIYGWNAITEQFYCIPITTDPPTYQEPIAVNLSANFAAKYNHVVIVTKNVSEFISRIELLNDYFGPIRLRVLENDGHLIMKPLSAQGIVNGQNVGTAVIVYARKARELYDLFCINYYFFFIESMGKYTSSVQCFFDHRRLPSSPTSVSPNNFGSRGLFDVKAKKDWTGEDSNYDVEDCLSFVDENVDEYFPPYRITAFDIEAARFDAKLPLGNTEQDRLCSVAFQTVEVEKANQSDQYAVIESVVFVYIPVSVYDDVVSAFSSSALPFRVVFCRTEVELLKRVLLYIGQPNATFITGWNIMNYDYRFLLNRAVYFDLVPAYITEYNFSRMCCLTEVFDLAPPWKLSIDTMECRKKFFPRHLPVNPPSNSIDVTAQALLRGLKKADIDILKVHRVYERLERGNNNHFKRDDPEREDIISYLKQLITYNFRDVELVTDLNGILQVVQTLVPLSQLADLNPGDCINYNATKIALTYMKNQFQSAVVAPIDVNLVYNARTNRGLVYREPGKIYSPCSSTADKGKKGTYKGATVLDPILGVHTTGDGKRTLGCLDFASLYPSIMSTFAVMRGYVTRISATEFAANRDRYISVFRPLHLPEDKRNVYLSVRNCTSSPIQFLCRSLIEKRKRNKVSAPNVAIALKILTNSVYGLCGVQGVLFDEVSAAMITGYGRNLLTGAVEFFRSEFSNVSVLYGDTDSIFVSFETDDNPSLAEMAARYNRHLWDSEPVVNALHLSVEAEFECVIFVRKKLYLARYKTNKIIKTGKPKRCEEDSESHEVMRNGGGNGKAVGVDRNVDEISDKSLDKISGFPQRLDPQMRTVMTEALHQILDLAISHSRKSTSSSSGTSLPRCVAEFYGKLFERHTSIHQNAFFNIKVKPLDAYKVKTGKHFYIGDRYEKHTGRKIYDNTYISVCEVIPLSGDKALTKKSFSLCLATEFDPSVHTLNRSASVTEFLSKTFDPILSVIKKTCNNDKYDNTTATPRTRAVTDITDDEDDGSLKRLSQKYASSLRNESLVKYKASGYGVFNFADCTGHDNIALKISTYDSWPDFHDQFVSNECVRGRPVTWIKEDFDRTRRRNVCLSLDLHSKSVSFEDTRIVYATIVNGPRCLFPGDKRKFYTLQEVDRVVKKIVPPSVLSRVYIKVNSPTSRRDGQYTLGDVLRLLCFIYHGKSLTYSQRVCLARDEEMFVIILPFIIVKKKRKEKCTTMIENISMTDANNSNNLSRNQLLEFSYF